MCEYFCINVYEFVKMVRQSWISSCCTYSQSQMREHTHSHSGSCKYAHLFFLCIVKRLALL